MSHSCFIHSATDGHLGRFHILVIVNNAAMNIGVLIFFSVSVLFSFSYIPRSGIAESKGKSIFIFNFLKRFCLFIFRQKERRDKERERNINVWLPLACPLLGTWPATQACASNWVSNLQPFGSQASTQPTKPHQPGPFLIFWGISILLSTVASPVCIPTSSAKWLPFLHNLVSSCLLIYWWQPFWQVWGDISLWF